MNLLALIPARIGSKGIPEKNLLKVGDFSLVERALFTAMNTDIIDDIIVSTDSEKIRNVVNQHGKYAHFLRPDELATDTAGSLGVIQHGLDWAEKNFNKSYDYIVLLEPPSPFRLPGHVKKAVKIAIDNKATSVVSLIPVGDYHPIRMKKLLPDGGLESVLTNEPDGTRRQDQEPVFIRNCVVYVFSTKTIHENKLWGERPFGFEMDKELFGINIDEPNDFRIACSFYQEMVAQRLTDNIEILPDKTKLNLIVYDFDGVLTNNKVYADQNGNEMVKVSRADGLGISEIKKLGIEQIIISTEKNSVVTARAKKLGISCLQGIENKQNTLIDYCKNNNFDLKNTAYVGNDINDIDVMKIAGISYCPADAHETIKNISDYTLITKGGDGVSREILDLITNINGE
jgi:YrbI family 3-deoxy-D-manno-octulosonate 8-phosphate phosphatase